MPEKSEPIRYKSTTRMPFLHYNEAGAYVIHTVTANRECLFGCIENGQIIANEFGLIVLREWMTTPQIRPGVELDVFCLMPNHFHGIVMFAEEVAAGLAEIETSRDASSFAHSCAALPRGSRDRGRRSISSLVAGFKASTTKQINTLRNTPGRPVWQPKFYDHVIRNEQDLANQREYIVNNPLQWELDEDNPERRP